MEEITAFNPGQMVVKNHLMTEFERQRTGLNDTKVRPENKKGDVAHIAFGTEVKYRIR